MSRTLPSRFDLAFVATGEVVVDVEALIGGVLGVEGWPAFLEEADEDELRATLLGDAVLLERHYRRHDGIEARPWLFQRLRFKARDWRRVYLRQTDVLSIDSPVGSHAGGGDPGYDFGDQRSGVDIGGRAGSHRPPEEAPGDSGHAGRDALRELLEGGDRTLLREIEALGLGPPPGARGRTPRAREWLERLELARLGRVARAVETRDQVAA